MHALSIYCRSQNWVVIRLVTSPTNCSCRSCVWQLDRAVRLDPRPEYHRAVASWLKGDDVATASSTGNQISSRLLSVKEANVLLRLPPKSDQVTAIQEGEVVDAIVIGKF